MKILPTLQPKAAAPGMALVMTVIILALVTVMILGFADLMRNETVSSASHVDRAQAQAYAETGVDMVVGTLREHASDPGKVWATQPGALIVPEALATGTAAIQLRRQLPLHSGLPSDAAVINAKSNPTDPMNPADLNVSTLNDPNTFLITDQHLNPSDPTTDIVPLPLRWIYVRKDGTLDDSDTKSVLLNAAKASNPVVGRFAYWTDDESSKVNINTAWKRNPPSGSAGLVSKFSPSHVSSVNLSNVFTSANITPAIPAAAAITMADEIHSEVTTDDYATVKRFFNSTKEIRALARPEFSKVYNATKFELTHYNHDPNTTFFNEPRIVLSTKEANAPRDSSGAILKYKFKSGPFSGQETPYYLNINKDGLTDNWWPGSHVDPDKIAKTVEMLNDYLKRTDWPMVQTAQSPPASIQKKFYPGAAATRLTQLSLNIINYVRSKESGGEPGTKVIIPIRGEFATGVGASFKLAVDSVPGGPTAYLGISRTPRITEMGFFAPFDGSGKAKFKVEIHLPKNFGIARLDLTKVSLYMTGSSLTTPDTVANPGESYIKAAEVMMYNEGVAPKAQDTFLKAGGYAVVTREATIDMKSGTERLKKVGLRFAIASVQRWDITPLGSFAECKVDDKAVPVDQMSSIEVDDPRVSSHKDDWKQNDKKSTFGKINGVSTVGKPSTLASSKPQQDTDSSGLISDASLYIPSPPGESENTSGLVDSPGELGYIHTGMESGLMAGVPWRTLRLQPNNEPAPLVDNLPTIVPDWAFMDLFTVPVSVATRAKAMFAPHGTIAGRINVNSQVQPYGNPLVVTDPLRVLERRQSTAALLLGVKKNKAGDVITSGTAPGSAEYIASNIYKQTLSPSGANSSVGKRYGYKSGYDSPGEIVEIQGVADGGEESEAVIRGIANLVTTRGGVMTVYSIGQTLQQNRNGDAFTVTGETRQQTMIERYTEPAVPPAPAGLVRFRRVSYAPITP